MTLDYARYSNIYSESYNNAFLPFKNAYLYRHGATEVLLSLLSQLINIIQSKPTSSTLTIDIMTQLKQQIIVIDRLMVEYLQISILKKVKKIITLSNVTCIAINCIDKSKAYLLYFCLTLCDNHRPL